MPVNFRSLRDSGITWEALAGSPLDPDPVEGRARAHHNDVRLRQNGGGPPPEPSAAPN